ncbi:MAG: LysM peptidoglycan-binding domain-containing protein [Fidelibacterota bacterium]
MKRANILITLVACALVFLTAFPVIVRAQEEVYTTKMKMEEYNAELAKWQKREADARAEIVRLDEEITGLKQEIEETEKEIARIKQETFDLLGVMEADQERFEEDVNALLNQLKGLEALTPEELYQQKGELLTIKENLEKLKAENIAALKENIEKLNQVDSYLSRVEAMVPAPVKETYVVVRGDYLWKIAGKEKIYNDPYQWMKIYTANRDQIKDPDLIYPDQIFDIPREPGANEYWVVKGEWLSKIASYAEVYNNPFEWTKIYEANRSVIRDPNLIYPHQILTIPRD